VHRTYVRNDRLGKAALLPNKAMLGPVAGGAVHLSNINGPLVVTEGIETGLSLLSGVLGKPSSVWAALNATGMVGLTGQVQDIKRSCSEIKFLGRALSRQVTGYHRRSRAGTKMHCVKLLGQSFMARDFDRQVAEIQIRAAILNGFAHTVPIFHL
jgi:hypothetical protein